MRECSEGGEFGEMGLIGILHWRGFGGLVMTYYPVQDDTREGAFALLR
jgi:hypothetical protein